MDKRGSELRRLDPSEPDKLDPAPRPMPDGLEPPTRRATIQWICLPPPTISQICLQRRSGEGATALLFDLRQRPHTPPLEGRRRARAGPGHSASCGHLLGSHKVLRTGGHCRSDRGPHAARHGATPV